MNTRNGLVGAAFGVIAGASALGCGPEAGLNEESLVTLPPVTDFVDTSVSGATQKPTSPVEVSTYETPENSLQIEQSEGLTDPLAAVSLESTVSFSAVETSSAEETDTECGEDNIIEYDFDDDGTIDAAIACFEEDEAAPDESFTIEGPASSGLTPVEINPFDTIEPPIVGEAQPAKTAVRGDVVESVQGIDPKTDPDCEISKDGDLITVFCK